MTAVCFIFLIKLRWPKTKSLYNNTQTAVTNMTIKRILENKIHELDETLLT